MRTCRRSEFFWGTQEFHPLRCRWLCIERRPPPHNMLPRQIWSLQVKQHTSCMRSPENFEVWPFVSLISRLLKVIGTDTCRSVTYDFLLVIYTHHGPISYRFWYKRLFRTKIANFFRSMYLAPPLRVPLAPWTCVTSIGLKNLRKVGNRATVCAFFYYY